jgi:hypothetical protein
MEGDWLQEKHAEHPAVQELLPWFAMDALDAEDLQRVERHLRDCRRCQADARSQRRLRANLPSTETAPDADRAYLKLRSRLGAAAEEADGAAHSTRPSWTHWTLAGLAASLALLLLAPISPAHLYHGMGGTGTAAGNIVVNFRPDTTEQELRQILRQSGARLVDGPTAANAYVLRVEPSEQERALVALRRAHAVSMAEPLNAKAEP